MKREDCRVGQKVYFGRQRGEKTPGEIIKKNPKNAKVRQIGERGSSRTYQEGTVWTVPYSLLISAESSSSSPAVLGEVSLSSRNAFKHIHRGDYVKFEKNGTEIHGIVERVNKKTVSVRPINEDGSKTISRWRVSPGFLTKIHGREI